MEFATGRRWTYRELNHEVDLFARGLIAGGHRQGRPRRRVVAQLCGVDDRAVRDGEDRRDPGQRQPVVPHPRVHLRGQPVGPAAADRRRELQDQRLPLDDRGDGGREPRAGARGLHRHQRLGRRGRCRREGRRRRGERADADPAARRPDQHPVHVGHHRLSQGRDAVAPQHPQQRLLRHRADQLHRAGPALHPGALLPLLRHGDGQPRLHLPRRDDGDPGTGLRPRGDAAGDRGGAVHRRLRRAHDVHRDAEPPDVRRARPVLAAHRDHGRARLPGRGDEALHLRHAHGGGLDRLRDDRDLARLLPDARRRRPRPPYVDHRPRPPARRDQGRRPRIGRDRRARADRGSSARAATR